ncbi:MAG: type III pantothenate kinase [Pseudomonadota bacterium]
MTLLLDIGNTRCKWGMWRDGKITDTGALLHADMQDIAAWQFVRGARRTVVCNVAGNDVLNLVVRQLNDVIGVKPDVARVTHEHAGVTCAYDNPRRLGVDRWMAVLYASRLDAQPAMVVDAGTAMTIDVVARDTHLGGLIIPGLNLMERSLMQRTADIDVDAPAPAQTALGQTTSDAVRNGALVALAGAVQRAMSVVDGAPMQAAQVTVTGGDGAALAAALPFDAVCEPYVVLEGLAIYAGLHE